jgi:hypothetical protein
MQIIALQNDFTTGEMDPKLRARSDIDQYRSGLAKATNVTVQPQGGAKRRPGTRYIASLPANLASQGVRMVAFEFSTSVSYMLVFVPGRMYVLKDGTLITNINGSGNDYLAVASITASIIPQMCWTQSYDTLIVVHEDLQPLKIFRGGNDATWTASTLSFDFIPKYAFTVTTTSGSASITPSATTGNIKITSASSIFSASDVNQYIVGTTAFGRARIIDYVSGTEVRARVTVPFFNTDRLSSGTWEFERGYEDAWSSTKGWPRTVGFYQGRLFFGGSKSLPSTVWGSVVGNYFDFNPGEGLADEAVEATADTGQYNAIVDMYPGRALQIFTTGAEFFVPQPSDDPITPGTFFLRVQTQNGARPGLRVVNVEGGTLFIQRQGKALQEMIYLNTEAAFTAAKISLLSSHLLKEPSEMAVRKSTSTDEGDRLLVVNDQDGSIACYTLLRSQKVIAPSEWTTDGSFISIGVDIGDAYAVVKRTVGGSDAYYVELFEEELTLDCAKQATVASSTASVSGLSYLNGRSVKVVRDGVLEADKTVSSGSVTFTRAATSSYQIGLNYTPLIKTLPPAPRLQSGSIRGSKKRVYDIILDLFETQDISVQGRQIAFRNFGTSVLDQPIDEYTGLKKIENLLGYDREGAITITQTVPLQMTVLGIEYKISVG